MVMNVVEIPNRVATLLQYLMRMFEFVCEADARAALAIEAATHLAMGACMACDNFHEENQETFPSYSPNAAVGSSEGWGALKLQQD